MPIRQLGITDHNVPASRITIDNPSWAEIENAIRSLDNNKRSSMGLKVGGEKQMSLGGGNGTYICQILPEAIQLWNPNVPRNCYEEVELVVDQKSYFSKQQCVSLDMVLQAARYYADHGTPDPSLLWEY